MGSIGALEQFTEPGALRSGIAWEVEDYRDAQRQESANVWPQRVPQPGRAPDESREVSDLPRKEVL